MGFPLPERLGLLIDLYELTMAAGYLAAGKAKDVTRFELSIGRLPANRSFLLAAGLEQTVEYLLHGRWRTPEEYPVGRRPALETLLEEARARSLSTPSEMPDGLC